MREWIAGNYPKVMTTVEGYFLAARGGAGLKVETWGNRSVGLEDQPTSAVAREAARSEWPEFSEARASA
jgi:hypothetical protein